MKILLFQILLLLLSVHVCTLSSVQHSFSEYHLPVHFPSPTIELITGECVGDTHGVASAGRQGTSSAAIAVSAILAAMLLLTLFISIVLVLWVVRLNKRLASVKGTVHEMGVMHVLCLLLSCDCM